MTFYSNDRFKVRNHRIGRMLKDASRRLLCNRIVGTIDYYCNPKLGVAWGGPFNGQPARQALFSAIVADIRPKAIIETGTYFGTTTEFMASTGLPFLRSKPILDGSDLLAPAFGSAVTSLYCLVTAAPRCCDWSEALCSNFLRTYCFSILMRIGMTIYP